MEERSLEKLSEFKLKRRVAFYETDAAGIVHFSCYLRYLEEAEHALWRAAGLSIAPRDSEYGWPRVAVTGEYGNPLRFEDEFVRHKILDVIGDLALVGHPLQGHLVVHRGGHALHTAFASELVRQRDCWRFADDVAPAADALGRAAATVHISH